MTILAQDTFIRSNQSGFGLCSDGINTWGSPVGTMTTAIASDEGVVSGSSGFPTVFCGTKTTTDSNFLINVTQNQNADDSVGPFFRAADNANGYFVVPYGGIGGLLFGKLTGGAESNLATGSFAMSVGTAYSLRVVLAGNHLQARIWQAGTTEPSTWLIDTTDSTYSAAGQFGLISNTFAGSDTVTVATMTGTDNQSLQSPATDARATFLVRAQVATDARAAFDIRAALASVGRATFKVRVPLAMPGRAVFKVRSALGLPGRVAFKIRARLVAAARATFKIDQVVTPSGPQGRAVTWKTRDGDVTWETRDGQVKWETRDGDVTWKTRS